MATLLVDLKRAKSRIWKLILKACKIFLWHGQGIWTMLRDSWRECQSLFCHGKNLSWVVVWLLLDGQCGAYLIVNWISWSSLNLLSMAAFISHLKKKYPCLLGGDDVFDHQPAVAVFKLCNLTCLLSAEAFNEVSGWCATLRFIRIRLTGQFFEK